MESASAGTKGAAQESTFSGDIPLVAVLRGDHVGSLHRGSFAVVDGEGMLVASGGNPDERVFLRSGAKPFQAMPAILAGAVERFRLDARETAVLCASHSAEPTHMETILRVLGKAALDEGALHCGVHAPLHEPTAADLQRRGIAPSPICNNCSGAHTGMLLACVCEGWPIDRYGDPDHPLQARIREVLATFAGIDVAEIEEATDNCAVPTFRLSLRRAALAFARLAGPGSVPPPLRRAADILVDAMTSEPYMVAGEARFDTDLMTEARGTIVSKGGAEAFQGIGLRDTGLGIALKISDGGSRAVAPASMAILHGLRALSPAAADALRPAAEPDVLSATGRVVGCLRPVFGVESPT